MDVLEFIVRRIQHILSSYFQKVRFMEIYSNKYRGQHKEHVKELKPDSKGIPRKDWDTSWRRLIWKIYDEDPLICVTCGTEMELKFLVDEALRCPQGNSAKWELRRLRNLKYYYYGRWSDRSPPAEGPELDEGVLLLHKWWRQNNIKYIIA